MTGSFKPKVDPTFFPLGEIPFESYCLLLDKYMDQLVSFVPSRMEEDLSYSSSLATVLYWYPRYVNKLYEIASEGGDFLGWLRKLNNQNPYYFVLIFPTTLKKLDKIKEDKLQINLHGEAVVKLK